MSLSQSALAAILPPAVPMPLRRAASRLLQFDQADRTYAALQPAGPRLLEGLLEHLEVRVHTDPADLAHIPRTGPAIVLANHPFGILEAAALTVTLRQFRPDVRLLANELLSAIPELHDLLIPLGVFSASHRNNASGLRRAVDHVTSGGLLLAFPSGAVSHFHWRERASLDPPWRTEIARFIRLVSRRTEPAIVPAYVPGSNSLAFHAAGELHPALRTALLARELFNKRRRTVELRFGHSVTPAKLDSFADDRARIDYLRWRTYLLANRHAYRANTRSPLRRRAIEHEPVIAAVSPATLAAEIEQLPAAAVLEQSGDLRVYLSRASQIPQTLREIGRLREIAFRAAGEGTGRSIDLDRFDDRYLHLFVWNAAAREIAGAYRLSPAHRAADLYTHTLFRFDRRFLDALGPAVELGRSFIRAEYQKGFAPLLLLWKGIGRFIAANPQYKTLFGPVSISNQYQSLARELMIAYLEQHAGLAQWTGLVRSRHAPPAPRAAPPCSDVRELDQILADVDPAQPGIPVLLRQYLKLGGKLLGFNLDPEFSDVLDGLIVVDLTRTEPKLLRRYLGESEASAFLEFHKEPLHGTHQNVHCS